MLTTKQKARIEKGKVKLNYLRSISKLNLMEAGLLCLKAEVSLPWVISENE